jgi:16S rRNA G966 N2-methylase RsmD
MLADEVKIVRGMAAPSLTPDCNSEYKYFLETRTERNFVERVHYFTSFYYLLVQISALLLLFAVISFALFFIRSYNPFYLLAFALYFVGFWIFHKFSSSQLAQIINEQIVMVRSNASAFESSQKWLESQNIKKALIDICKSQLTEIILDPIKRNYQIECEEKSTLDWRTGLNTIVYILKIKTSHPIAVSGEPGGYKGFYKERVESVLNQFVSIHQKGNQLLKVIVEVIPVGANGGNLESLISLQLALHEGIVKDTSPVVEVAKKYGLEYILIRGRHLIGPNPGLVRIIEDISKENPPRTALDLFCGTGIIPIVLHQYGVSDVTCVDNCPHFATVSGYLKKLKSIKCINEDAFSFPLSGNYGLLIADPYYQDALRFLEVRISDIFQNTNIFVFVCCGVENEYLRNQCLDIIKTYFSKNTEEKLISGQSIIIGRK